MKPAEIRELSDAQLVEKLKEMRAELFNLRFQMATSQLDNTARVNTVKKDIARVLTEQRAREIAAALAFRKASPFRQRLPLWGSCHRR